MEISTLKDFKDQVYHGLIEAKVDPNEIQGSKKEIFRSLDKLFTLMPSDGNQKQTPSVKSAAVNYFQSMFEAKLQIPADTDIKAEKEFKKQYAAVSTEQFKEALSQHGVDDLSSLELQSLTEKILAKPPVPNTAVDDANTVDAGEMQDLTEQAAAKSSALADTLKPVITKLESSLAEAKVEVFDEIFKIFDGLKGEEGKFESKDLDIVKKELNELMSDYSPENLKAFLEKQDPAIQFELAKYMKDVISPIVSGLPVEELSKLASTGLQDSMVKGLNSLAQALPSRPEAFTEADVLIVKQKREHLSQGLALIAKEGQRRKAANSTYNVDAYIKSELGKLQQMMTEQNGATYQIHKEDIQIIAKHLENTNGVSSKKQNTDIQAFMNQYGKYALMAVPMILGPLANVLARVPIIGRPLAGLAPIINSSADKFGPMLIGMFFASGNNNQANPAPALAA